MGVSGMIKTYPLLLCTNLYYEKYTTQHTYTVVNMYIISSYDKFK